MILNEQKLVHRSGRLIGNLFLTAAILLWLGLLWFFDAAFGISASWVFCIFAIGFGALLSALIFCWHGRALGLLLGGIFSSVILWMHFDDSSPIKPYRRFYDSIHRGMSEAEIMRALNRQFPVNGRFPVPAHHLNPNGISFLLDPSDGRYNAECISLTFDSSQLKTKEYWPD